MKFCVSVLIFTLSVSAFLGADARVAPPLMEDRMASMYEHKLMADDAEVAPIAYESEAMADDGEVVPVVYEHEAMADEAEIAPAVYEHEGMADETEVAPAVYEHEGMADETEVAPAVYEHEGMADEAEIAAAAYEHEGMADDPAVYEHEAMADEAEVAPVQYENKDMSDDSEFAAASPYEYQSMADEDEIVMPEQVAEDLPMGRANECQVTIRGGVPSSEPQPVYLKTDSPEFYPYSDKGVMQFNAGSSFQLYCPKKFTKFDSTLLTATCVSGSKFKVGDTTYDIKEFVCTAWPAFVAEKTTKTCNGGVILRTGFAVSSSRFAEQMTICFNEQEEVTRYVRHDLSPAADYYQTGIDRLTFQTSGFFGGKNVDKLYTQNTQKETINKALGYDAGMYFDTSNIYLARGHMGAKADFVYGTQQRGTFLFVNAEPQWQSFNAGNWARVEDGLRTYVTKNSKNVYCYTGVYGVTTLPNANGVETKLYLDYDSNNNGLIPVPMLYFRVVIEPSTNKGIVFLGVNNPHLSLAQIQKDYIICNDVSDQVTYINWKKTDIKTGYSYACTVEDFVKNNPYIPNLTAKNGLLL